MKQACIAYIEHAKLLHGKQSNGHSSELHIANNACEFKSIFFIISFV